MHPKKLCYSFYAVALSCYLRKLNDLLYRLYYNRLILFNSGHYQIQVTFLYSKYVVIKKPWNRFRTSSNSAIHFSKILSLLPFQEAASEGLMKGYNLSLWRGFFRWSFRPWCIPRTRCPLELTAKAENIGVKQVGGPSGCFKLSSVQEDVSNKSIQLWKSGDFGYRPSFGVSFYFVSWT